MWRGVICAGLASCAFHHGATEGVGSDAAGGDGGDGGEDATADSAPDAPPPAFCPVDGHLRLCLSFDQSPLPATLPDEGAATVNAQLTNVTRIAGARGGAAKLDATSEIYVPYTAQVSSIQAIEVWFRIDTDPANNGRGGLVDSNVVPPNISLFFYRVDPAHQLRCGIGSQTSVFDATLSVGSWIYLACVCDGANMVMYVDGLAIGQQAGACATGGALVTDGLTIGSNNNGGPSGVNDWLVGAIDGLRLWDETLGPATVCQTAGRPGC